MRFEPVTTWKLPVLRARAELTRGRAIARAINAGFVARAVEEQFRSANRRGFTASVHYPPGWPGKVPAFGAAPTC
jgi:hypothetical protein